MKAEEFTREVMHHAGIESRTAAHETIRATLETLSEHLTEGESKNLASQLPPELALYLQQPFAGVGERFSLDEFFARVSQREGVGLQDATHHARVVASTLGQAIDLGALEHLVDQLPTEIATLFMTQSSGEPPDVLE